jgi:hypothetical protein
MRARVNLQSRQPAAAIEDYDRAIAVQPTAADPWYGRALCHYSVRNYHQARADLDEFIRLGGQPDPKFVKALSAATSGSSGVD